MKEGLPMKRPIVATLIGSVVAASLAGLAVFRIQYLKDTKEELDSLPYGAEKPLTWKHFFKNYDGRN